MLYAALLHRLKSGVRTPSWGSRTKIIKFPSFYFGISLNLVIRWRPCRYCGDENCMREHRYRSIFASFFLGYCDRPSCYHAALKAIPQIWYYNLGLFWFRTVLEPCRVSKWQMVFPACWHTIKRRQTSYRDLATNFSVSCWPGSVDGLCAWNDPLDKGQCNKEKPFSGKQQHFHPSSYLNVFSCKGQNKTEDMIRRIGLKTGLYAAIRKITKKLLPNLSGIDIGFLCKKRLFWTRCHRNDTKENHGIMTLRSSNSIIVTQCY
jgi:hypothetical protein